MERGREKGGARLPGGKLMLGERQSPCSKAERRVKGRRTATRSTTTTTSRTTRTTTSRMDRRQGMIAIHSVDVDVDGGRVGRGMATCQFRGNRCSTPL